MRDAVRAVLNHGCLSQRLPLPREEKLGVASRVTGATAVHAREWGPTAQVASDLSPGGRAQSLPEIFALPESHMRPLAPFITCFRRKRLWPLLRVVAHSHPVIGPCAARRGLTLTPNPVMNMAASGHQRCNSVLPRMKGAFKGAFAR